MTNWTFFNFNDALLLPSLLMVGKEAWFLTCSYYDKDSHQVPLGNLLQQRLWKNKYYQVSLTNIF